MPDRPDQGDGPVRLRLPVVGTASAHIMVQVAAEFGMSRSRCLAGTGIEPKLLDDSLGTIRLFQELAVAGNLVAELGDVPALGFRIGQRYRLTIYGAWGWAMLCSPTPRHSLEFASEYLDLSYAMCDVTIREADGLVRIGVSEQWLPERIGPFFGQRSVGAVIRLLSDIMPANGWLKEVRIASPEGPQAPFFREVIDAPLLFDRPETEIVVYSGALDHPMPMANEQALQLAASLCREQLERRRAMLSVGESVRHYLLQRLAESPSPATAALALGMGTRTLRRRLAEEGTSFRELHDQVRRVFAVELLEAGLPPARVARRLGYAGPAAFTHAFRRWHGVAPREFASKNSSQ